MGHTLVVAEIGANHNGDYDTALRLIKAAKDAGADAVKFQLVTAEGLCHPTHAAYETVKRYALPREWMPCLMEYARHLDIQCSATPCDFEAVDLLDRLDAPFLKIASGDLTYHALIRHAAKTRRHLIISTGMATDLDVYAALTTVYEYEGGSATLLQCTVAYPATARQANLSCMKAMGERYDIPVGFSDHTLSTTLPAVAVGLGATVIEKHFTLSRCQHGPDHGHSLTPSEFKAMVHAIREAEVALGDGEKKPLPEEADMLIYARRGLYFARDMKKGEVVTERDLVALRPICEMRACDEDLVVGKKMADDIPALTAVRWGFLYE